MLEKMRLSTYCYANDVSEGVSELLTLIIILII